MKDSPKQPLTPTEERAVSSTQSRAFAEASLSSGTLWQRAAGLLNYGLPIYALAVSAASSLQSPFLLLVRLYWGWQFAQTGWGKMHDLAKITNFFASLHIPFPGANAHFVSGLEFFGGLLLIAGLGSRFISLLLAGNMMVAYWTADHEALVSVFSDPGKFYNADPLHFSLRFAHDSHIWGRPVFARRGGSQALAGVRWNRDGSNERPAG